MRSDGRKPNQLRPLKITPSYIKTADGSVLIEMGDTRVICTAKLEERVPPFLRNSGKGWITAEYGMLPGSSQQRIGRESSRGKVGGRTHEIQRLIGRSLRSDRRSQESRRALYLDRLRRDSSRWRHAHGIDHRRLYRLDGSRTRLA